MSVASEIYGRIEGKLVLAPMEGVGTSSFITLCSELGAPLVFPAMLNARAYAEGHITIPDYDGKALLGVQFFGSSPEYFGAAAERAASRADIIDINTGCPAWDIVEKGYGCGMMASPENIGRCVKAATGAGRPVWVKMRLGPPGEENFMEVARLAVENGAEGLTLHPRPCEHSYLTPARWEAIGDLVREYGAHAFIIGNGDVFGRSDARRMMEETGCRAVMVARAAMYDPGIFFREPVPRWRTIARYMELAAESGDTLQDIKLHLVWLSRGLSGGKRFRNRVMTTGSIEELRLITTEFIEKARCSD